PCRWAWKSRHSARNRSLTRFSRSSHLLGGNSCSWSSENIRLRLSWPLPLYGLTPLSAIGAVLRTDLREAVSTVGTRGMRVPGLGTRLRQRVGQRTKKHAAVPLRILLPLRDEQPAEFGAPDQFVLPSEHRISAAAVAVGMAM